MTCNEFESQIVNFINEDMDYSILKDFLSHLHSCENCYDDLTISYLTNVGLEKIDNDDTSSYDFLGELKQLIKNAEKKLDRYTTFGNWVYAVTIVANVVVLVVIAVGMLHWFDIL